MKYIVRAAKFHLYMCLLQATIHILPPKPKYYAEYMVADEQNAVDSMMLDR